MKITLLIILSLQLFAKESTSEFYKNKFKDLENEKINLIKSYESRLEIARIDRLYKRVNVLSKTLTCFKSSRSKRDLAKCKTRERKRIMSMIRG